MNRSGTIGVVALSLCLVVGGAHAQVTRPTNYGSGADAEVRESNADQNRGTSTEIATRVRDSSLPGTNDANDRNSVIYLQFDLADLGPITTNGSTLRMTLRNNNMSEARIHDTDGVAPDYGQAGFDYYGIPGASFDEGTITYNTAPGITPDGDIGTKDFNGSATLLGDMSLPEIGTQNHLPVGMAFDFGGAMLDAFLMNEMATNPNGVAVIAVVHRHTGLDGEDFGAPKSGDEPSDWINFNYLFNPKEQTTLNEDLWDADVNDPNNPLGSPDSGADNSTGLYSPQLIFLPAPHTGGVLLAGMLMVGRRRR